VEWGDDPKSVHYYCMPQAGGQQANRALRRALLPRAAGMGLAAMADTDSYDSRRMASILTGGRRGQDYCSFGWYLHHPVCL